MKAKTITGIISVTGILSLLALLFLIQSKAQTVPSVLIKLAMVNFSIVLFSTGLFLLYTYCEQTSRSMRLIITSLGIFLAILSFLVSFDILPFLKSWNWLVSGGILFIMLVQLQLLNWGKLNHNLVRFTTLFVILADAFLIFFFIAKWSAPAFAMWLNIAAISSVALTYLGLLILLRTKEGLKVSE